MVGQLAALWCGAVRSSLRRDRQKIDHALSPKRISALINAWGFALMTPFGIYVAWQFDFQNVPTSNWLLLVFYALAASVWSVWLWMTGLRVIPASAAGVYTVFLPISAALVGVFALGESLNYSTIIGDLALAFNGRRVSNSPLENGLSEGDLAVFPLKKQQIMQKKVVFPYENMIFSSSIRTAIENKCLGSMVFIGGFST